MRLDCPNTVVDDQDVDILLYCRLNTVPETRRLNPDLLMRHLPRPSQPGLDGSRFLCLGVQQAQSAIAQIESMAAVSIPCGCVCNLIVQSNRWPRWLPLGSY